jgi:hypothetical protein
MIRTNSLLVPLVTLLLLVGCFAAPPNQQASPAPALPVATATPEMPAATATAVPEPPIVAATPEADPVAACPDETEGMTLYVSAENGFCFLYPSSLKPDADMFRPEEVVQLIGSPADPSGMHSVAVNLSVAYNGPADGLDSAQYAATWLELNMMPGTELPQEPATIGGQPAILISDLPGMFSQLGAFVVANGAKYQITLQPKPQDVAQLAEEATLVWETVTGSIVFFPPQSSRLVVQPADVCPTETAGSKLAINRVGGYCLLYPADFAPDPDFPSVMVGGPELGPFAGFESVRASLAVGTYELGNESPEQALRSFSEQIDSSSVTDTTIGGYPAVIFDFTGGPWRQRNAKILVGNTIYTFVGQPWDIDKFPHALADVERLWTTITGSIAFFDKWR